MSTEPPARGVWFITESGRLEFSLVRSVERYAPPHQARWSFKVQSVQGMPFYDYEEGKHWCRTGASVAALRTVHALTDPPT